MLHLTVGQEDFTGIVGPHANFDQLYDRYSANGGFEAITHAAWAEMLQRWSVRSQVELQAGSTALTGTYYPRYAAEYAHLLEI